MWAFDAPGATPQRTAIVPAVDPRANYAQNAPIEALATFEMYLRDTLDFYVDLSTWLAGNGGATLTGATWASVGSKTPTLSGQAFVPTGLAGVTVAPAQGAVPGDAYLLDVTFSIGAVAAGQNTPAIPARQITRRICIILVNG